jgi:hypothetical protein
MGDAKGLLEQVKTFCSKHSLEYELFEQDNGVGGFGAPGVPGTDSKAPDRIVGDAK